MARMCEALTKSRMKDCLQCGLVLWGRRTTIIAHGAIQVVAIKVTA